MIDLEKVGVPVIDADHQKLAAVAESLRRALVQRADRVTVISRMNELIDGMCDHNNLETLLMRSSHYKNSAAHRHDHNHFIFMLSALIVDYQVDQRPVIQEFDVLIKAWRTNHIRRFDQPLAEAIRTHSARQTAPTPQAGNVLG